MKFVKSLALSQLEEEDNILLLTREGYSLTVNVEAVISHPWCKIMTTPPERSVSLTQQETIHALSLCGPVSIDSCLIHFNTVDTACNFLCHRAFIKKQLTCFWTPHAESWR